MSWSSSHQENQASFNSSSGGIGSSHNNSSNSNFHNRYNENNNRNRKWWNKLGTRRRKSGNRPVGTEAVAVRQMQKNARIFSYPEEGFEVPIEHSLLYAMISQPADTYPFDVVSKEIEEEEFESYMLVNKYKQSSSLDEEPVISYAQLSALLARSAEKNTPSENTNDKSNNNKSCEQQVTQVGGGIPEVLVKRVLKCVVQYSEANDLDREAEVKELLDPVERYASLRGEKAALKHILPLYVGYAASLATGNPLPLIVGFAVGNSLPDRMAKERKNQMTYEKQSNRVSSIEKTSLLDEADDEW